LAEAVSVGRDVMTSDDTCVQLAGGPVVDETTRMHQRLESTDDSEDFATAKTGLSCAVEQQPVVFICQETQPWDLAGTSLLNLL
jgi:hypothetical protein